MADDPFFAQLSLMTLRLLVSIRVATVTVLEQLAGTLVKCLPEFLLSIDRVFSTPIWHSGSRVSYYLRFGLVFGRYTMYSFVISARVFRASLSGMAGGDWNGEFPM